MPRVAVNGTTLYFEEHGDGEPLLFISGLGRNHTTWNSFIPPFTARRRCIVFDNRGTGRSEVPAGQYTIEQMADDAAGLLDALDVASADCIGVSLGGSVLQALAYRHPTKVRRAVLISSFPNYTALQHAWLDAGIALRQAGVDPKTTFISSMPWVFTSRLLTNHVEAEKFVERSLEDPNPTSIDGFLAQADAIRCFDSRERLCEITAESLILVGAEDILTPIEQSVEMAELIPASHLVVLPRGGHGLVAEYMDDVTRAVRRWLC